MEFLSSFSAPEKVATLLNILLKFLKIMWFVVFCFLILHFFNYAYLRGTFIYFFFLVDGYC